MIQVLKKNVLLYYNSLDLLLQCFLIKELAYLETDLCIFI